MNADVIKGNWKELKGKVRTKWGKLTDDDVAQINGSAQQLEGALQKHYGYSRERAEKEIEEWSKSCGCC